MKKVLFLLLVGLTILSCQKKESETLPQMQEVSFTAIEITPGTGLKSTADWECKTDIPTHAWVVINGDPYYPELFSLDGKLYTQSIKLAEGTGYCVTEFVLYKEVSGTGFDPAVDIAVFGTPHVGSDYAVYVNKALGYTVNLDCVFNFDVVEFTKAELDIQVLCYLDADYDKFGFNWFAITEIVIREQCFFGDFCIKHPSEYNGSNYGKQPGWPVDVPFYDAPAIVSIDVFKKTQTGWAPVAYSPFTNNTAAAGYGVGAPVCIQYPDNLSIDGEKFKVILNILVKNGNNFIFESFHEWEFEDEVMIIEPHSTDGVIDFVLGNCVVTDADYSFAPYMNLPSFCTYYMTAFNAPYSYVKATLGGFGAGYDLLPGVNASYCGDFAAPINWNTIYNMDVYSSLYLPMVPAFVANAFQWDKINWIINHLDMFPGYGWQDLQAASWMLATPVTWNGNAYPANGFPYAWANLPIAQAMVAAANTYGEGYLPLPGGYACVIFVDQENGQNIQTMFVLVDP